MGTISVVTACYWSFWVDEAIVKSVYPPHNSIFMPCIMVHGCKIQCIKSQFPAGINIQNSNHDIFLHLYDWDSQGSGGEKKVLYCTKGHHMSVILIKGMAFIWDSLPAPCLISESESSLGSTWCVQAVFTSRLNEFVVWGILKKLQNIKLAKYRNSSIQVAWKSVHQ